MPIGGRSLVTMGRVNTGGGPMEGLGIFTARQSGLLKKGSMNLKRSGCFEEGSRPA